MEKRILATEAFVFDSTEKKKLRQCLNYCWHRLTKHERCGLRSIGVTEKFVEYMRKNI